MEDPRMSKRIDLTQFEGMSDNWEVVEQVVEAALRAVEPAVEYAIVTGRDNSSLDEANIIAKLPNLTPELKKMYAREDELLDALRVIKEDLEAVIRQGYIPQRLAEYLTKIRNFANDASL